MARLTRKQLKQDNFAAEVGHTVEYVAGHRKQLTRAAIVAAVVIALGAGIYFYIRHQRNLRQAALAEAIRIQDTLVGQTGADVPTYPTQEAKDKEVAKALNGIIEKYSGSQEAAVARYYLGTNAADQGRLAEAEKQLKASIESADDAYASLGKVALAQVYLATNRAAEGEKLLREVMAHPTVFVSKEQGAILLAEALRNSKPQEARKLLEPLRTSRTAVSQVAIGALGEIGR